MSYQYGSSCYPTSIDANRALAYDRSGQQHFNPDIGTVTISGVGEVNEKGYQVIQYGYEGQQISSTFVESYPPECSLMGADDAIAIGWMIAGVWIAAWSISVLRKILSSGAENDT